jgi:Transposase IS116/IS110/IS902 family
MTVFPTAGHLASWAGRCPGNNITGGKRRSGKPTRGNRWLADVLTECAWAAARSRDTYLAAQFWRLARRIGKQEGRGRRGPLHPGHRLVPTGWRLRRPRPRQRLLHPARQRPSPASGPSPSSRPSATRSPSNPPPNTRRFSFQESTPHQSGLKLREILLHLMRFGRFTTTRFNRILAAPFIPLHPQQEANQAGPMRQTGCPWPWKSLRWWPGTGPRWWPGRSPHLLRSCRLGV